jgi:hypothetical protein
MGVGPIPKLAAKRRVLVIVDEHDLERLQYEGGANVLLDGDSWVINAESPPEDALVTALDEMNLLVPGQVLVQNPYLPDRYVPVLCASADIAASKHHLFTAYCHLLGAKRVTVTQVEVVTDQDSTTVKAEGGRLGFGGSGSLKSEELRRLAQQMSINAEASGAEPDLDAAEAFLRRHRLTGDQHFVSLLDMRRHQGNSLRKHTMTLALSDQTKTNLKIAAKLKAPTFSFSADIERATSHSVEFNLSLEVEF